MDRPRLDNPMPSLHPRLAGLDPALDPALRRRVPASRARLLAGTLGACVVLTFAAHAFPGPPVTVRRELAAIGVEDVRFELFDAGHGGIDYRYPLSLAYLVERLS